VDDPVAITYSERTIGSIDVDGTYPNSIIVIPNTGVYKVLFSAQCDAVSGNNHYLEIFPVINGDPVPNSNTRMRLSSSVETCLVAEYLLSFNANDELQLYIIGSSTDARILAITRGTGIPNIPSIIVTIMQIA
jgi:hypothetical protein